MDHLADLLRNVTDSSGISRQVLFRFSHHCFTDSSRKENDFRKEFIDPDVPDSKIRVFCPKRWLLSRDLKNWLSNDLSKLEVVPTLAEQWVLNADIPGIDKPYCVFFKFGQAEVGYSLNIEVKSAFIRGGGRVKGEKDRFIAVLKNICSPNKALSPIKLKKTVTSAEV
jgi:hypothetical protein